MSTTPKAWTPETSAAPALITYTNPTANPVHVDAQFEVSPPRVFSRVDEHTGERHSWQETWELRRITWAPGESKAVPATLARAIHQVGDCGHTECERSGHWCRHPEDAGAKAAVQGGAGWMLIRENQRYRIDPALLARPVTKSKVEPVPPDQLASRLAQQGEDPAIARARKGRQ
jgi:hypothetical protein